jgi:hypothetical protein
MMAPACRARYFAELDDDDRARLHAALDAADDELRAGKGIPEERIVDALRRGEL